MDEPNFKSWYPVFGIRSYEQAIDYYVDWLGFHLDWEWREAPGQPAIVSISREGITIGLNESVMNTFRPLLEQYYFDETKFDTYLEQLGITYPTVSPSTGGR